MTRPQGNFAQIPPLPDIANVLFDFNPAVSLTADTVGGITLTDTVGGVTTVVAHGQTAAEFDGTNYLLTSASPFAALSALTGGVSIYVVCERTDAVASNVGIFGMDDSGATLANTIELQYGSGDVLTGSVYDPSAVVSQDIDAAHVERNSVAVVSFHATLTSRTIKFETVGAAAADVVSRSPAGLDRIVIGGKVTSAPANLFTGRIYRLVIREGAYDVATAEYLFQNYRPFRLPPSIDWADVVVAWEPRHALSYAYGSSEAGFALTQVSTPTRVVHAGDVGALFDVSGYFHGLLPVAEGDLDATYTAYIVQTNDGSQAIDVSYLGALSPTSGSGAENWSWLTRDNAGAGAQQSVEELSVPEVDWSGTAAVIDQVQLATYELSPTEVQSWLDGTSNGATAGTKIPRGVDKAWFGVWPGVDYANGHIIQILVVRAARDAAVETWLNANLPVGWVPPQESYTGPDSANLQIWWSAQNSTNSMGDSAVDVAFTEYGTGTTATQRGRTCYLPLANGADYFQSDTLASPISPASNEKYTLYILCEFPTGGTAGASNYMAHLLDEAGTSSRMNAGFDTSGTFACVALGWGSGGLQRVSQNTGQAADTVYLMGIEMEMDASAGWGVKAITDTTLGSAQSTTTLRPNSMDILRIADVLATGAEDIRIWDVWLFNTGFSADMDAYAKGLLT